MDTRRTRRRPRDRQWVTATLAVLLVAGCTYGTPEPPSTRDLPLGDARRYAAGRHRYQLDLELQKSGKAPQDVGERTTRLSLDIVESVTISRGLPSRVLVTVTDATVTGDDAEGERAAALGRVISITPNDTQWEIGFSGGALGTEGRVRAADLALLAHLLAPTEPALPPLQGDRIPERANIRTGWSTRRLDIAGSSQLTDQSREQGRKVSRYDATLAAEVPVSVELGTTPAVTRTDIANATASTTSSLLFNPLACVFTLGLGCLIPVSFSSAVPDATVDMSGPMAITQQAVIHRETGRLLRLDGQGRAQLGGSLPTARPPRQGPQPQEVRLLSAAPVGLNLSWKFSERLADPWPKDPLPFWPFAVAGAGLILVVLLQLVVVVVLRRRIFR